MSDMGHQYAQGGPQWVAPKPVTHVTSDELQAVGRLAVKVAVALLQEWRAGHSARPILTDLADRTLAAADDWASNPDRKPF